MTRIHHFRLATLRRARSFAVFMLLVFMMRVGIAVACEPHEFAELFAGESQLVQMADRHDGIGEEQAADPATDHCRQCNCHHGITLPYVPSPVACVVHATAETFAAVEPIDAPPERHLRPPIV